MKYIVEKNTPLFEKLQEVKKEIQEVITAAENLIEKLNVEEYYQVKGKLAGGIDAVYFPNDNPDKKVYKKYHTGKNMFTPKKNTELFKEFEQLPVVEYKRLNDIVNFKQGMINNTNRFLFCPKVDFKNEYILISVDENKEYTPVEFMNEITVSEYQTLKDNEQDYLISFINK